MSNIFTEIKLDIFVQHHPRVLLLKRQAKEFKKNQYKNLSLMQCQEIVAQLNGFNNWHHFLQIITKSYEKDLDNKNLVVTKEPNLDYDHILLGHDINLNNYKWQHESDFKTHQLIIGNNFNNEYDYFLTKQMIKKNKCIYICNYNIHETENLINFAIENKRKNDLRIIDFSNTFSENLVKFKNNFNTIKSSALTELLYGLFISNRTENIKGKCLYLVSTVSLILVYLRDDNQIKLNFNTIKEFLNFNKLTDLKNNNFPTHIKNTLEGYLNSFEKFNENNGLLIKEDLIEIHKLIEKEINISIDTLLSSNAFDSNGIEIEDLFLNNTMITFLNFSNNKFHNNIYQTFINSLFRTHIINSLGYSLDDSKSSFINQIKKRQNLSMKHCIFRNMKMNPGSSVLCSQARALGISITFSYDSFEYIEELLGKEEMLYITLNTGIQILKDNKDKEVFLALTKNIDLYVFNNQPKLLKTYNLQNEVNKNYFWLLKKGHEYQLEKNFS